ncbi:hypothetical protein ACFL4J_01115 [Candidatus Margulisiibacteriota bacterium]
MDGISLTGVYNAFKEFLFGAGSVGGATGCNNQTQENKPSAEVAKILAAHAQDDAGAEKAAPPVSCEPNRMVILRETVIFGPATAGEAFPLAPFDFTYADQSGTKEFPKECTLTVADQSVTAKVNEIVTIQNTTYMLPVVDGGLSIVPIPIKITPEGTLTVAAAGDYDVSISCLEPNAFSMDKIGMISIKPKGVASKPRAAGKKATKTKKAAGPCSGLSGVFLSACKKKNNL